MYRYDEFDDKFVRERVAQFRGQVQRRLDGLLTEEEFKPLRLMNGLYLQLHAYMIRVAIPYGVLSARQMRALANIADQFDRGYGHFTTRQNIQFNWPKLVDVPDLLDALADVEMHAIQTSGNCIRNITSDPLAGVAADEIEDPRPTAELLRQWSSLHPEFSYLPRKFKIAVTGSSNDRAAVYFHDVGLRIVRAESGTVGYQVIVGGGQGRTPVVGVVLREFLPKGELLGYLEALMRVYNLHGRRDNKYKARIKILVKALGVDAFRSQVDAAQAAAPRHSGEFERTELARITTHFEMPKLPAFDDEHRAGPETGVADIRFQRWVNHNTSAHKIDGYCAVTVTLKRIGGEPGDASSSAMRTLATVADEYSQSELRVTHEQNIVLPYVAECRLYALWRELQSAGLGDGNHRLITDIIACPGLDYCALATARAIPVAQAIATRFAGPEEQADIGSLSVKISGCINACGHHHVGHIGILGLEKAGQEYYQITLGGDATETAAIGERAGPGFSATEIVPAIERVVGQYRQQRNGEESFLETYRRVGIKPFKESLYATDT
jgi:sulfite reductase (NADPH) hemoprotein beta-component